MDTIGKGLGALGSLVHSGFLPSQKSTTTTTESKTTSVATSVIEENSIHSVTETKEKDSIFRNIIVVDTAQESKEIAEINSLLENLGTAFKDFEKRVDENFGKMSSKLGDLEKRIEKLEDFLVCEDSDDGHSNVCRDCHSSSTIVPEIPTKEINTPQDSGHGDTPSGSSVKSESAIDS